MFFNQLDERNAMVRTNHVFEELGQTGLGTGLACSSKASTPKCRFFVRASNGMIQICLLTVSTIET